MPHIVLEYSDNLPELPDFRALFDEIHQAIGRECLQLVKRYYHLHLSDALQITVKIDDIALDFYFKDPAGTLNYQ